MYIAKLVSLSIFPATVTTILLVSYLAKNTTDNSLNTKSIFRTVISLLLNVKIIYI